MTIIELLVGAILPYIALLVFMCGLIYRFRAWQKAPQPGNLTLYPTRGWGGVAIAKEILFFPNLYKEDKPFWLLAWSFHVALALAFVGHLRAVTGRIDSMLQSLGLGTHDIEALSLVAGGAAGLILMVAAVTLILRRLALTRVREISSVPDFVALLLLTAVITTGNLMRFGSASVDLTEVREWASSLLSLTPAVPSTPAVLLHLFCAEVLILYFAFSKLMHFGGAFYTMSLIRRS